MFKHLLLIPVLFSVLVAVADEPLRVDASSQANSKASLTAIADSLTVDKMKKLKQVFASLALSGLSQKEIIKKMDGLTADEITSVFLFKRTVDQ